MAYPYPISSDYGPRPQGDRFHDGVDFNTPDEGAPLGATQSGIYRFDWDSDVYGRMGWVEADDGNWYLCAHLAEHRVRDGTRVEKGEEVALSGGRRGQNGAGNSTGSHVHFEVRKGSKHGSTTNPDPKYIGGLWYPVLGKEPVVALSDADKKYIREEVQNAIRGALYLIFSGSEVASLPVGSDFEWRKGLDLEAVHAKLNKIITKTGA